MPGAEALASRPQRAGWWLLALGALAMLCTLFLTPPWGLIGLAVAVVGAALLGLPLWRWPLCWAGAGLSLWVLASNLWGWWSGAPGSGRVSSIAYTWLALPLVAAVASDAGWRRRALPVLSGLAVTATALALVQFTVGCGDGVLRIDPEGVRGIRAHGFNSLHLAFGFACAVTIGGLAASAGPAPWLWTVRAVCMLGAIISGARSTVLGAVAGLLAALSCRGWRWACIAAILCAAAIAAAALRYASTDPGRLQAMLAGQDGRWPIWQTTLHMIAERPLLGIGHRKAYELAYSAVYERVQPGPPNEFPRGSPHAHNWLLALAAEHGIPAALLHLGLVGSVWWCVWRRRHRAPAAFQAANGVIAAAVVCAAFEPFPIQSAPGIGFHAMLGLVLGWSQSDATPAGAAGDARSG